MGKIITGVLIVSVIYLYIKKRKKEATKKENIATQTEPIIKDEVLPIQKIDSCMYSISEEILSNSEEEEYIQTEESQIQEVEQLSQDRTNVSDTEEESQANELKNMSVIELKELAKQQNIKGFSRMKKTELIEILS